MAFNPFASRVAEHNTVLPTLANTDISPLQLDASGRLIVTTSGNDISITDGGNSITVDAVAFDIRPLTQATDSIAIGDGTDILGIAADGSIAVTDNGLSLTVDNGGTFAVQVDGAALTSLQTLDNAISNVGTAAGLTDGGQNILGIRDDVLTALADPDGDYVSFRMNSNGALWTEEVNSSAMLTSLQTLDNMIAVEDAVAGDAFSGVPMLAVRQDTIATSTSADGDFSGLKVNALGELYITGSLTANVDDVFESGTEADGASDNVGDGIVPVAATMTDLATVLLGAGVSGFITGMDISADEEVTYELVVNDLAGPSEWIRVGVIDGAVSHNKQFPRAIEIAGAANRSIKLRALANEGGTANVAGAINMYTR